MWLNLAGAALIVAAAALMGFCRAGFDTARIKELLEFKKALLILASEIEFTAAPLPEAAAHIAARTEGAISRLFGRFAEALSQNNGETASQLWEAAIADNKPEFSLTAQDFDHLLGFGKTLGYLDKQMQLNTIRLTAGLIDGVLHELRESAAGNKRMYRGLGVIGGLLMAVLLW